MQTIGIGKAVDLGKEAAGIGGRMLHVATDVATAPARNLSRYRGPLQGMTYRLMRRHPDPSVDDRTLADRIRSSLGPLEKQLDIPHVHVQVANHVATLHGDVENGAQKGAIEYAVRRVDGVRAVDSHLKVGLIKGESRPSENKPPAAGPSNSGGKARPTASAAAGTSTKSSVKAKSAKPQATTAKKPKLPAD